MHGMPTAVINRSRNTSMGESNQIDRSYQRYYSFILLRAIL